MANEPDAAKRSSSPAKLLSQAKNACGDRAVGAAQRENFAARSEWTTLAMQIDALLRQAVSLMAAEK